MRFSIALATVFLAIAGLGATSNVNAQANCSNTFDANKKYCAALDPSEWEYWWHAPNTVEHGPFDSESAALADLKTTTLGPNGIGTSWCDMALDQVTHDTTPTMLYGMERVYNHSARYNTTIFKNDPTPCNRQYFATFLIRQSRRIECPDSLFNGQSWALITTGTGGPHCEIPMTGVWDRQPKMCKGNPCDVLNGSKFQLERDYFGSGEFPLTFTRTYESRIAFKKYQGGGSQDWLSPLGIGWTATYFQSIRYSNGAQWKGATVLRPEGRRIYFNETAGVMAAQSGIVEQLIKLTDGSGAHTGWKLILANDVSETYDASGRLVGLQNRTGLTQTVTYVDDGRMPQSVSDSFGHALMFSYDSNHMARLQAITLPDGNQITFTYSTAQNPVTVNYPGGASKTYHFELTGDRKNLLTGITDEEGVRYATWEYGTSAAGVWSSQDLVETPRTSLEIGFKPFRTHAA